MVAETRARLTSRGACVRPVVATLPWAAFALGVSVHVTWYLVRGSIWFDESLLALNILHRSPAELLDRLWFVQGAPWGFLEAEKLAVALFGAGDHSLRLVPQLVSLASLPVFWRVASFYLQGPVLALAIALFGISPALVLYSAEVKQYSLDVLGTLLAVWFGHAALRPLSWRGVAAIATAGALLVWFSHASLIALAACGLVAGVAALVRRDVTALRRLVVVGGAWGLSVGAFFLLAWPKLSELRGIGKSETYGIPFPPANSGDSALLLRRLGDIAEYPFGSYERPWSLLIVLSATTLAVVGTIALLRRLRWDAVLILAPLAAIGVAVALDLYPYGIRFLLFLVPLVLLLVAAGIAASLAALSQPGIKRTLAVVAVAGAAYLVTIEALSTVRLLGFTEGEEMRPVLEQVRREWQPGDVLFLQSAAQYPARYYAETDDVNVASNGETLWRVLPTYGYGNDAPALRSAPPSLVIGKEDTPAGFAREVRALRGERRVWFVFGLVVKFAGPRIVGDVGSYTSVLDGAGHRRVTIKRGTTLALLYDLRG